MSSHLFCCRSKHGRLWFSLVAPIRGLARVAQATVVLVLAFCARVALAAPDGLAPPEGFVDRSGVTELVFWQGVNGLLAGSVLGY